MFASCSLLLAASDEILEPQAGAPKERRPLGAATLYPDMVGFQLMMLVLQNDSIHVC